MRVASIVGARPQFIKAAGVSEILRRRHDEILIHTGQHYDDKMSQVFFDVLGIPPPDLNLGIGSGPHGHQTGRMLEAVERALMREDPDKVIVYGDTNSTLAGALAAVKLQIETAHVEAGVRSFNMSMPEEVNRIVVDRVASQLFCPTPSAVENLGREGIHEGVHLVGDVMYDAALKHKKVAREKRSCEDFGLRRGGYLLLTIHRPLNADAPERLEGILRAVASAHLPVLFPAHPRTQKVLDQSGIAQRMEGEIAIIEPQDYLTFMSLLMDARKVVTDSGGVQKEAYIFGVPCVTLRGETEWEETLTDGWNVLANGDTEKIVAAVQGRTPTRPRRSVFGDGKAAQRIVEILERESPQ